MNVPRSSTGITVIIPTHNRQRLLALLLESLHGAISTFGGPCEVLVVDDSPSGVQDAIRAECTRWNAGYLAGPKHVGAKRNLGAAQAKYSILLFIDSDCVARPDILDQHWRCYQMDDDHVGGVVGLTEWYGTVSPVWKLLEYAPTFTTPFRFAEWVKFAPWGTTSNLSVRADVFSKVGGFDEAIPMRIGGEDVDIGLRINDAGYVLQCNAQAIVLHTREEVRTYWQAARKNYLHGRADSYVGDKHPDYLKPEFPQSILALGLWTIGLPVWIARGGPWFAPIAFIIFALGMYAALRLRRVAHVFGLQQWLRMVAAITLEWAFELGKYVESIKQRRWSRLYMKMVYLKGQLEYERDLRIEESWSILVAMLLTLLLCR